MKIKAFRWAVPIVALVMPALSVSSQAQDRPERDRDCTERFRGVINAYTLQTEATAAKPATGPYEVRGPWSLTLKRDRDKADFSAALNMELSDGWVLTLNQSSPAPFDPSARNAHTHHITMHDADVTELPGGGFQVSGPAFVTLNGGATPFAQTSPLTIVVSGGSDIKFSNITLTFAGAASGHFGTDPLSGVVRSVKEER